MSRTVSARIPTPLHEELRERCNLVGESINDFVKAAIEFALYNSTDFDFGDEEEVEIERKEESKPMVTEIVEPKKTSVMAHVKIYDDKGNLVGTF